MTTPLFSKGYRGLADSRWSGVEGSVAESVGIDAHSTPGLIKVHQKLAKDSSNVINELCKVAVAVSDGSKLWFSSSSGKVWRENTGTYSLVYTTPAIEAGSVRSLVPTPKTVNTNVEVDQPFAIRFKPDGLTMYVLCLSLASGPGDGDSGWIFQYTLTTAFDISTASYDGKAYEADNQAISFWFKPDGTKFYVVEDSGSSTVIEYNLATAWDIATASASGSTYNFSAQGTRTSGIQFNPDGTKMFLTMFVDGRVDEYTLGTAWNITTATYVDGLNIGSRSDYGSGGSQFNSDGSILYVFDNEAAGGRVYQYDLATSWDVSTATYTNNSFSFGENSNARDIEWGATLLPNDKGFAVAINQDSRTVYYFEFRATVDDTNVAALSAEEHEGYVYWTTANRLCRVPVASIDDFADANDIFQFFTNGDDTYHPMVVQNAVLFIGDRIAICQVDFNGVFSYTNFTVPSIERIQTFGKLDIDVLVGTRYGQYARVLRWDTVSDSWSAEDMVYEPGISAFIHDDNFLYAYAGNQGRLYFYNGEKLERFTRIRGTWNASNSATVHAYSVAYYNGIPVFALSTVSGTPCKMGVYSIGSFSPSYPIALDLAYPLGNTYNSLTFGAVIVDGSDLYVAASDGVYAIDHLNKYEYAHIETRQLATKDRDGAFSKFMADYVALPSSTGITFSYRHKYASNFTPMISLTDANKEQVRAELSVADVTSLQLRVDFTVSGNNSPEIEQFNVK